MCRKMRAYTVIDKFQAAALIKAHALGSCSSLQLLSSYSWIKYTTCPNGFGAKYCTNSGCLSLHICLTHSQNCLISCTALLLEPISTPPRPHWLPCDSYASLHVRCLRAKTNKSKMRQSRNKCLSVCECVFGQHVLCYAVPCPHNQAPIYALIKILSLNLVCMHCNKRHVEPQRQCSSGVATQPPFPPNAINSYRPKPRHFSHCHN